MKIVKLALVIVVSFMSTYTLSAQNNNQENKEGIEEIHYFCPMKCEGNTTYTDKKNCPECGMKLNKLESAKASGAYFCPMKCETDKKYAKKGNCPECGMKLDKTTKPKALYICPMNCEGEKKYKTNVGCPKCGMDLKK